MRRLWARFFIIILPFLMMTTTRHLPVVSASSTGRFFTRDNQLFYEKHRYHIRGINWFGMEAVCNCPNGLWVHYMNLLRSNSIRIPFSYEVAVNLVIWCHLLMPGRCYSLISHAEDHRRLRRSGRYRSIFDKNRDI